VDSALYTGHVRHRRNEGVSHSFRYSVFMVLLDLDELDRVFLGRWLWSTKRPAPAWFRREDYFGDPNAPLSASARDAVESELGWRPTGPIRLLTNLRYFGYRMNPVSFYFCYDPPGKRVDALILEVTNTPWGERHVYVVDTRMTRREARFDKAMHVSPFFEMDYVYRCRFSIPGNRLGIRIESWRNGNRSFDATLGLRRAPVTGWTLAYALARYPFMTAKVAVAIYWQAFTLTRLGAHYYPHPDKTDSSRLNEEQNDERTGHA